MKRSKAFAAAVLIIFFFGTAGHNIGESLSRLFFGQTFDKPFGMLVTTVSGLVILIIALYAIAGVLWLMTKASVKFRKRFYKTMF